MTRIYIVFISIFLILWGGGVFFTFLTGLSRIKPKSPPQGIDASKVQAQQRMIASESKEGADRTMDNYKDQIRRFRDLEGKSRAKNKP